VRKIILSLSVILFCGLFMAVASAATFKLSDGRTVTGDLVESGSNDATALISLGGDKYDRVPWGQFSQEDLKMFLEKYSGSKKITEAVQPFIEVSQEEKAKKTEITIKPVDPVVKQIQDENRLPKSSVIGSFFKSGLGLFLVLLIYGANIFAGYEIGIFRAQPVPLVTGLAAIPGVGFITNIVYICMPTRVQRNLQQEAAEAAAAAPTPTIAIPGQEEAMAEQAAIAAEEAAAGPKPEIYTRKQFTFNKRFFETKFPGYFGMVRKEEDRTKVLTFKTAKGEFVAQRISRITPTDIHLQVEQGGHVTEMQFHFPEIQEVTLIHHA
jgi:hypothetical protein